jgi:hypothetical protein
VLKRWYAWGYADNIRHQQAGAGQPGVEPKKVRQKIQGDLQGTKCNTQIGLNKEAVDFEKIKKANLFIIAAPKDNFTPTEIEDLKKFVENGGNLLVLSHEGGERRYLFPHLETIPTSARQRKSSA